MLSVIIPCFECKKTLKRCVESVIKASPIQTEILLIEDGSQDGTLHLARELERMYEIVSVHEVSHKGASAARNYGLDIAKGEYITFVDSDDEVEEDAFSKMLCYFDGNIDLVMCGQKKILAGEKTLTASREVERDRKNERKQIGVEAIFRDCFFRDFGSAVWGRIYRKEIIEQFPKIRFNEDLKILEDLCFLVDYFRRCDCIIRLPYPFYIYYVVIKDKVPLELVKQEQIGYNYLLDAAEFISPATKQDMELVYLERMTRRIAKMRYGMFQTTEGQAVLNQCRLLMKKYQQTPYLSKKKKLQYKMLTKFPILGGVLARFVLKLMRFFSRTVD